MIGTTFRAPSGNVCKIEAACVSDGTDNMVLVANWEAYPSPADEKAFNDWFEASHPDLEVKGSRDMSRAPHEEIARRSENFVRTGRFSLPEEN